MPKLRETRTVKFLGYTDLNGNPLTSWQDEFIGTVGLLYLFESVSKPGNYFFYFYPSEPENPIQRFFHSSVGTLSEKDNTIHLRSHHDYEFLVGDFLTENEINSIVMDVYINGF